MNEKDELICKAVKTLWDNLQNQDEKLNLLTSVGITESEEVFQFCESLRDTI